jgi:hypothetical protein
MMALILSLVSNDDHVANTQKELVTAGFTAARINVLYHPVEVWQRLNGHQKMAVVFKHAAIGGLLGIIVGALYGVPAGVFNCTLMNCPQSTSIIMWALITLFWIMGGGILGALIGLDQLERDLYDYVEGVRRGEALIVVESSAQQVPQARRILQRQYGTVIRDIYPEKELPRS